MIIDIFKNKEQEFIIKNVFSGNNFSLFEREYTVFRHLNIPFYTDMDIFIHIIS